MKKSEMFRARISPGELAAIKKISDIEGTKPTETFRALIREGLNSRGLPPIGVIESEGIFGKHKLPA